jgi:hypothetical protein
MKLTFDKNTHTYYLDDKKIPSCSAILSSCGMSDYSQVPKDVLEASAKFGSAVHKCCELWDKSTLDESSLSAPLIPYRKHWIQFLCDFNAVIVKDYIETPIGSLKYRFGCTPDRVLVIKNKVWVLEIKTTSTILPAVGLQLAAQKIAIEENYGKVHNRVAIQLTEDGYKLFPLDDPSDESTFLACLRVWNWKERNL